MKRAQSEYIGMALLALVILIFAILSRLGSQQTFTEQSGIIGSELTESYVNVNAQTILYSTASGVPLSELLGDYVCYGDKMPDYGTGPIDLEKEIQRRLDAYYGPKRWRLVINASTTSTYVPQIVVVLDPSGSMGDAGPSGLSNTDIIEAAVSRISPTSRKWKMGEDPFATALFGGRPANNCDLSITQTDPGVTSSLIQKEESWANIAGFIAEHGAPLDQPPYFDGWPPDVAKIVFISSDERSCSRGPTKEYVDYAIQKAVENDVKYYFIVPPVLYAEPGASSGQPIKWANDYLYSEIVRFSEGSGGKAINITSVNALAEEIEKAARVEQKTLREFNVDSKTFSTGFEAPKGRTIISYAFPLPTPCSHNIEANGILFAVNP